MPLAGLLEEVVATGSTPGTPDGMPGTHHGSATSFDDDLPSPRPSRGGGMYDDGSEFGMKEASSLQVGRQWAGKKHSSCK